MGFCTRKEKKKNPVIWGLVISLGTLQHPETLKITKCRTWAVASSYYLNQYLQPTLSFIFVSSMVLYVYSNLLSDDARLHYPVVTLLKYFQPSITMFYIWFWKSVWKDTFPNLLHFFKKFLLFLNKKTLQQQLLVHSPV